MIDSDQYHVFFVVTGTSTAGCGCRCPPTKAGSAEEFGEGKRQGTGLWKEGQGQGDKQTSGECFLMQLN